MLLILIFLKNEDNKISQTKKAIKNKTQVIFEGFFSIDNLVVKPDILKYNKATNSYTLIEVKATTKVKPEHCLDVMFQYLVLTKMGLKINGILLMFVNKDYSRSGELDVTKLFSVTSIAFIN